MSASVSQRISFRLHQWLGLISAVVLLVVGATGALLAVEDEVTSLWPGPSIEPVGNIIPAPVLIEKLALPGMTLQRLYLEADATIPGRALYQLDGKKEWQWRLFNPYSGETLGPRPAINEFFADVMALHRWLLLPNSVGSVITGSATLMAIVLLVAGFIRRAPDRLTSLKDWLWWKRGSKGRHALWQFHALIGTWFFIPLLLMSLTGPWFAFDWYRDGLKQWLGSPEQMAPKVVDGVTPDGDALWRGFLTVQGDGRYTRWFIPKEPQGVTQVRYLESDAPHSRAYSAVTLDPAGHVVKQQSYRDLQGGDYLLANMYAFHTGVYFGLPGKLIWSLAGLAFASFSITGVWLFFNRRARPREQASGSADTLIAYASQSGTAAAHSQRLKQWLDGQGKTVHLRSVANLQPQELTAYRQVLVLASTYGEGLPPDSALLFQQRLAEAQVAMQHVQVAVLAFGDRQYQQFCAFGHWLAGRFQELGAVTLLPVTEVDRGAEQQLQQWSASLAQKLALQTPLATEAWQAATVEINRCLNPGSARPVHDIELVLQGQWQAGDLLEVMPIWSEAQSRAWLEQQGMDAAAIVQTSAGKMPLWQAQSHYLEAAVAPLAPQQYVDQGVPLAPRSYSIASVGAGRVRLMVRQVNRNDGHSGRASQQLTQALVGSQLQVRLKAHVAFRLPEADVPLILLAAGTGLAPYLGFLQQRRQRGFHAPIWLLYGERYHQQDNYYAAELQQYLQDNTLSQLDYAWSRDDGVYVQQLLEQQLSTLQHYLQQGAHLYVCGGIDGIGAGVQATLLALLGQDAVQQLLQQQRYHRDLY